MKFLLVAAALSVTVVQVLCKELKCDPGFMLVYRNPTPKNNHTSAYCLGFFQHNETFDHDTAMTICHLHKSVLSIPENFYEWNTVTDLIRRGYNMSGLAQQKAKLYLSIDGFFNPHCKDYNNEVDYRKHGGICELDKNLLLFQDDNTDPSYIITRIVGEVPAAVNTKTVIDYYTTNKKSLSECLSMDASIPQGSNNVVNHFCTPLPKTQFMGSLCGTRPTIV